MPKRTTKPKTQTNPKTVPTFEPPPGTALVPVTQVLTQLGEENPLVKRIAYLISLPATDIEVRLQKAEGLRDCAQQLGFQRKRIMSFIGDIADHVNTTRLWADFPGDEYETEREFWEKGVGIPYSEIVEVLKFYRHVRPLLNQVDVDADEFYEGTGKAGIKAAYHVVQDLTRQNVLTEGSPLIPADSKTAVREKLTQFQGKPDIEVKQLSAMQKGEPEKRGVNHTLSIENVGNKVTIRGTYRMDLDDVRAMAEHHGYITLYFEGNKVEWFQMQTMLERRQRIKITESAPDLLPFTDDEDEDEEATSEFRIAV